ncbi:MAG: nitroreductase [Gemmatimonadaceae bacterium]|nr:nitroreductase [Gemmatimonadaceae bacterium]
MTALNEILTSRHSIRRFTDRAPTREELEQLFDAAVLAPNHRLTNPWRFYVLGPEGRAAYGLALGNRKAKKATDEAQAEEMRKTTSDQHRAWPCMVLVAMTQNENLEIREEDYAATMMATQNLCLKAVELGLGTHIRSGAIMGDPAARAAGGVAENERIVAVLTIGTPAEVPEAKPRTPARELTHWIP